MATSCALRPQRCSRRKPKLRRSLTTHVWKLHLWLRNLSGLIMLAHRVLWLRQLVPLAGFPVGQPILVLVAALVVMRQVAAAIKVASNYRAPALTPRWNRG